MKSEDVSNDLLDAAFRVMPRGLALEMPNYVLRDMLAAVINLYESNKWQDISTAPKEGIILTYSKKGNIQLVFWDSNFSEWITLDGYTIFKPTHWAPVPEKPEE